MTFTTLFPTVVYTTNLNPCEQVTSEMLNYFETYVSNNCIGNDQYGNKTGDVTGDFQIASKREFSWLNRQVAKQCFTYLSNFGVDANLVNLHASKSWPVDCYEDGGAVAKHIHPNSHLSVVFYLQSDLDSGGELFVYPNYNNPTQTVLMHSFIPETHPKVHNCHYFEPIVNQMIIFPSSLWHEVDSYFGKVKRYSVTYDVILSGKRKSKMDNEMGFIHPDLWVNLYS